MNIKPAYVKLRFAAANLVLLAGCIFFSCSQLVTAGPLVLKSGSDGILWSTGLKSLLFGAVLLSVVYWLMKHSKGRVDSVLRKNANSPTLLGSKRISTRSTLLVIGWQGRTYLLVEQGGSTQLVDSRDQAEIPT